MSTLFDELNQSQREVVSTTEGYVRVIAGAGSGKTRALVHRFAYLVNEIGVLPKNILCATFTNKASEVMKTRIKKLTNGNDTGYIGTFHSFCVTVLQEDSNAVQYPKSFLVLDNSDIDSMLQVIYEQRGLTLRQMTFGNARDMIEMKKTVLIPNYYNDMITMSLDTLYQKYIEAQTPVDIIFYGYLYQQKKCFALDYNDLIKFVLYIFEKDEDIKLKWQKRLEYIMVDEFQDIDFLQYQLMEVLSDFHKNLFIVGDPDQTIYTWRGADIRFLMDFDQNFSPCKTIFMNENYRSSQEILDCANSLIDKNKNRIEKQLVAMNNKNQIPIYHHAKTTKDEAIWITKYINELLEKGEKPNQITILYRSHFISRTLEEIFLENKIAFTLFSGTPFFEREEIKDALCYLRMIAYKDDLSFRRIVNKPRRNIGKTRIALLEKHAEENNCTLYNSLCSLCNTDEFKKTGANSFINLINNYTEEAKHKSVSELLSFVLNTSGYETTLRTEGNQTRLDNLAELLQAIYELETSCGEECDIYYYLSHAALMSGMDLGETKNCIKLMTIHTAKGLEFKNVIICGLNEGIFPSKKIQTKAQLEEERRLAFVALTRAKSTLALTDAEGRNLDGSVRYPSRFIFDIDKKFLYYTTELGDEFSKNALESIKYTDNCLDIVSQAEKFVVGDKVHHSILGDGTIISIDLVIQAYVIQFDNLPTPRSISFKVLITKK